MNVDEATYEAFRAVLNEMHPGWFVGSNGLEGPGGAGVRLAHRHGSTAEGHVDVLFVLDEAAPGGGELWDCVAGYGATPAARAAAAGRLWAQTTGAAVLELKYSRTGQFADHYRGHDLGGLFGWHTIHGGIVGFGLGDTPGRLQKWWLSNPVLPALSRPLEGSLHERDCPAGLKIMFGGESVAEVRVNGVQHDAASAALAALPWPRLHPAGFARSYVLVLHPDPPDEAGRPTTG